MPKVKFVKGKKTVKEIEVEVGTSLRQAAKDAGVDVYPGIHKYWFAHCPGTGLCTSCLMHVKDGTENVSKQGFWEKLNFLKCAIPPIPPFAFFARIKHQEGARLSCQTTVQGDIEVEATPEFDWHGEKFWG